MRVLVLGHEDVKAALEPGACAETIASVLVATARGETYQPLRSVYMPPGATGFMGLMPAWRGGEDPIFAIKALCVMPGNPARGLDAHQGTVTLFDGELGVPAAILDASAVTEIRTAAVSAVATQALAREDARVLGVLGAGVQGRSHLDALRRIRTFERVHIYAPTESHATALALKATEMYDDGVEVTVTPTPELAVREADVIVTATNSREPVLRHEWLAPGAHINAIGASSPSAREIDTATVAASALFCDNRESLRNEAGEFIDAISAGAIDESHVRAELGEVLAGARPGRQDQQELTLFRSLGLAVEDLAAADHAVRAARQRGLGTEVEL